MKERSYLLSYQTPRCDSSSFVYSTSTDTSFSADFVSPRSAYTTASIADLHHPCSQLSAHSLPDGWIIHVDDTHSDLILSSLLSMHQRYCQLQPL